MSVIILDVEFRLSDTSQACFLQYRKHAFLILTYRNKQETIYENAFYFLFANVIFTFKHRFIIISRVTNFSII